MKRDVIMPRMGQGMEEGVVVRWLKQVGDRVSRGEHIVEIESDKATVEVESFHDGRLVEIVAAPGETVPVGGTIALIEDGQRDESETTRPAPRAEAADEARADERAGSPPSAPRAAAADESRVGDAAAPDTGGSTERAAAAPPARAKGPLASPVARRLADEHGIDLATVTGTGPDGRISREDVEKLIPRP